MAQPTVNNQFKVHNDFVIYGRDAYNLSKLERLTVAPIGDGSTYGLTVDFGGTYWVHEFNDEQHAYNMREYYMKTEEGVKVNIPANLKVKVYHPNHVVEEKTLLFAR